MSLVWYRCNCGHLADPDGTRRGRSHGVMAPWSVVGPADRSSLGGMLRAGAERIYLGLGRYGGDLGLTGFKAPGDDRFVVTNLKPEA